jgi:hypothetical protein
MVSNAPSGNLNGQGWTFGAYTAAANETMVINAMCAPRQGGYVQQSHIVAQPPPPGNGGGVYAECVAGYFAIAGGVYLSKPDGSESPGTVLYSVPGGFSRWFASGNTNSASASGTKLVAVANCIPTS